MFRDVISRVISFILYRILNQYKKIVIKKLKNYINNFITIFELLYVYKIKTRMKKDAEIILIKNIYFYWRYKKPIAFNTRNSLIEIKDFL